MDAQTCFNMLNVAAYNGENDQSSHASKSVPIFVLLEYSSCLSAALHLKVERVKTVLTL